MVYSNKIKMFDLFSIPTADNIDMRIKYIVFALIFSILLIVVVNIGNTNKILTTLAHLIGVLISGYAGFNILYFNPKNNESVQ